MSGENIMRRWEIGIIVGLGIILSLIFYQPILSSGSNLGIQDWDQNFAWTENTRVSLLEYHQFPFWNPYKCGGSVHFAYPQIPVISFQTVFALIFGTVRGIKLNILFHGAIGFVGFYFLARQYKLSYIGSLLSAIIFSYSGITGSFLSSGMVVFTSFAYAPYILICLNKSFVKRKWGIPCGIFLALSFYVSHQITLLLGMYIIIYCLVTCIVKRTLSPLKALIIVFIASSVLMLPKLLLSIQLLIIFPHSGQDISGYSLPDFLYLLLFRNQNLFQFSYFADYYNIDENSIYVGMLPVVLFLLFFISNKKGVRNNITLLITLLILFWIMLGSGVTPSLYKAIQDLPIYSAFRVAQRYRFDFIIPLALIIGLGIDNLLRLLHRHKFIIPISITILMVIYVDLSVFSFSNFLSTTLIIQNPASQLLRGEAFIQTAGKSPGVEIQRTIQLPGEMLDSIIFLPWSNEYLNIVQNQGVLECYDSMTSNVYAVGVEDDNYQGEYYLLNSAQGVEVENTFWSPNKLVYKITDLEKGMNNALIINQNFYPGWFVNTNNNTCSRALYYNGLLATRLDYHNEYITFIYNPYIYYSICN
jgi:hypothetical protein